MGFGLDLNNMSIKGENIPDEVMSHVCSFLSVKDRITTSSLCRSIRSAANDSSVWQRSARALEILSGGMRNVEKESPRDFYARIVNRAF